jgi:hypothetical protein
MGLFVKMSRLPNGSISNISRLPHGCSATPGFCSATPGGYSLATSFSTYSSIESVKILTAAPGLVRQVTIEWPRGVCM